LLVSALTLRSQSPDTSMHLTIVASGMRVEVVVRVAELHFLYVADSKLCSRESLVYLAAHQGRFITVLPRTRREDGWFRRYVQDHAPPWLEAVRRPNPRRRGGPEDVWKVVEAAVPSGGGLPGHLGLELADGLARRR